MNVSPRPLVTVAIITRNRSESLRKTLEAVSKLSYSNLEIVVVDNDSSDNTKSVVNEFEFCYLFSDKSNGFAKTRQIAVDAASGEFLLWCDDDVIPIIGWVEAYINRFQKDDEIGLIAGKIVNHGFPEYMRFKGLQIITSNGFLTRVDNPETATIFSNLNMGQRMSAMKSIGGYDPFFRGGYEEVDLNLSFRAENWKVVYEENAVVDHYHCFISYKKGRFFFGSQLMRLYFYFKHRSVIKNEGFIQAELSAFGIDIMKSVKISLAGIKRRDLGYFFIGCLEVFNAITSRLVIPWIIWETKKTK
ncbi:glycosyltransferase [uncultured Algoriphagus sp.]|uniref:glycosyltransferase family 2 protein n=1 Tax=uncultured Algoriphagus sp. TaxID=417365 RepID=UPI0030EB4D7D